MKFRIEVQDWTFEACSEVRMLFKNILEVPDLILVQFPYKIIFFKLKIAQIEEN